MISGKVCSSQKIRMALAVSLAFALPVQAAELKAVLSALMNEAPRATAARSDQEGAESRVSETVRRAWTPSLELTQESGTQRYQTNPNIAPPVVSGERFTFRATQLIYDFGRTGHQIGEAEAVARQSGAVADATRDGLLLEALSAHWSVVRSQRVLEYSQQSEASVRNQAQLENSMVELGKGYESNVLQAKVQLATAEARRVRAEGALEIARARVGAVFGKLSPQVQYDRIALSSAAALPRTLEIARETALENNSQLKVGVQRSEAIRQRLASTQAKEFLPRLQLVTENGNRRDIDGSPSVNDRKVTLQLQYNVNAGMAGLASMDATRKDFDASVSREVETRDLVLEQVTIAWRNLQVARINKETLENQVRIAAKFFEMASAERQLGRRSLLDVLSAEISVISAQSDLATTEADVAIAGLTLLQSIGKLDLDVIEFGAQPPLLMPVQVAGTAAAPTPGAAAPVAAAGIEQQLAAAVEAWRADWAGKNVKDYLGRYAGNFVDAKGKSGAAWAADRSRIIGKSGAIEIAIEGLEVVASDGEQATVRFRQSYRSSSMKSDSTKILVLVRRDGRWLIQQEREES